MRLPRLIHKPQPDEIAAGAHFWFTRLSSPIIFLILVLTAAGAYLAFTIPIAGYSLRSDTVPPTQLWEMATYQIKPRLNRLDGVSTVVVQGGEHPEFHVVPDPAKLLAASVTVPDILEAVRRTNLIDSPGLLPQGHEVYLALVNGQVRSPDQIGQIVIKSTPAGLLVRIGDVASV